MTRFRMKDIPSLEISPTSPATLRSKLAEMLINSISATARVEMVNQETGEYRVVLHGLLDTEDTHLEH